MSDTQNASPTAPSQTTNPSPASPSPAAASADTGKGKKQRSGVELLADAGDVQAQNELGRTQPKAGFEDWKVGQPAPSTKYQDRHTGEVSDKEVGDGSVVVFEGDTITQGVLNTLAGAK